MKNTFLEAVSHDMRTPLTSILGSALTLEQTELELPREDSLDLVHRIAANSRKLERLLSDLLDLDRLQRGIISPQRRPTELDEIVRRSIDGTENPGRIIEVEAEPITVAPPHPGRLASQRRCNDQRKLHARRRTVACGWESQSDAGWRSALRGRCHPVRPAWFGGAAGIGRTRRDGWGCECVPAGRSCRST